MIALHVYDWKPSLSEQNSIILIAERLLAYYHRNSGTNSHANCYHTLSSV